MTTRSIAASVLALSVVCGSALAIGPLEWAPTPLTGPAALGVEGAIMGKVVADPVDPNTVWALTAGVPDPTGSTSPAPANGVWKSVDLGETWTQMNDGVLLPAYSALDIAISPADPQVIYVATVEQGVFKSTDGGINWLAVNDGLVSDSRSFPNIDWGVVAVGVDPVDPDLAYCSVAEITADVDSLDVSFNHPGFFRTTDGGASWTSSNNGLPGRSGTSWGLPVNIVQVPGRPGTLILGMANVSAKIAVILPVKASTQASTYYSTDSGLSFKPLSNGLPVIDGDRVFLGASVSVSATYVVPILSLPEVGLYLTHFGAKATADLADTSLKLKSRGVYGFHLPTSNAWRNLSGGLPEANNEYSENSVNLGVVGAAPMDFDLLVAGVFLADSEGEPSENSDMWATLSGWSWLRPWDSGLGTSPAGYTSPVPLFTTWNADQSVVFSSVSFAEAADNADDGVWRLPPTLNMPAKFDAQAKASASTWRNSLFERMPFPLNLF